MHQVWGFSLVLSRQCSIPNLCVGIQPGFPMQAPAFSKKKALRDFFLACHDPIPAIVAPLASLSNTPHYSVPAL